MLKEGAMVVLAGRPNAGKSSLFNALLGMERAIVTEIPGTTRDAVEAHALLGGYPFRLVDTAGLRETSDRVESIGIEVATRYLDRADILLFCAESTEALSVEDQRFLDRRSDGQPTLLVRTKLDQGGEWKDGIGVSVQTGEGLGELGEAIVQAAFGGILPGSAREGPLITSRRQSRALEDARAELDAFVEGMGGGLAAEFAATHLRATAIHLEEIVGVIDNEDVLDALFSRFCVGK